MDEAGNVDAARASARRLRVILAGGGTGGHLYPGLAVAEALRKLARERGLALALTWSATPRAVDQRLLSGFGADYVRQPVRPMTRSPGQLWAFWRGWRASCALWRRRMATGKGVDCLVAWGGYAAGPAAYVAAKRGVPVVLLNPDAVAGKANRFLWKRADVIVTQFAAAEEGHVKALGCPIRAELMGRSRGEGAARLGVDAGLQTLVVTGASLGARTINDAVPLMMENERVRAAFTGGVGGGDSHGWQIIHLAGMAQAEAVRAGYAKWPGGRAKVTLAR